MTDNERIAVLTSGAIKASGEKVIADIMATIEAAEQMASTLRAEGEHLIADIKERSDSFADRVSTYVSNCQTAMEAFRLHQSKIFEDEEKREEVAGDTRKVPVDAAMLSKLEKEISGV
jgi:uncharacterized protein YicC (UPF0701 family)